MADRSLIRIRRARAREALPFARTLPEPPHASGSAKRQPPVVVLAEAGGRRIGYAALVGQEIRALHVEPGWTGELVAERLLARLEREARALNHKILKVRARPAAAPFFRRHGYSGARVCRVRTPSGELVRAVLLQRRLGAELAKDASLKERSRANRELREAEHLGAAFLGG